MAQAGKWSPAKPVDDRVVGIIIMMLRVFAELPLGCLVALQRFVARHQ